MAELCAVKVVSKTASDTVKLDENAEWLFIANKSGADLVFTASNDSGVVIVNAFTLKSGDEFDMRIRPFRNVDIMASGFYQVVCSKYVKQEGGAT